MDKAPDAYRTISEVGEDLDIAQHVLRFWETRFPQIKPLKRGGGRRYYRPDDVELLKGIRHLLYREGYTIKGVQRILKEQGARAVQAVGQAGRLLPGLAPAAMDDAEPEAMASAPPSATAPSPLPPSFPASPAYPSSPSFLAPSPVAPGSGDLPEPVAAHPAEPIQPALLDLPAIARAPEGHVAFTRGGMMGVRPTEPLPATDQPTESPRRALLEALGELEAVRANIGRVLAGRERVSGK